MRTVTSISRADKVNMDGIILDQPLPSAGLGQQDPFLLIHHWNQNLTGNRKQQELGVGPHPHRGFSPVTVIYKGALHHRDSLGNNSIVSSGGVQWMNAGKGITHSERPSKQLAEEGGVFEVIQFWINVPAQYKMKPAEYIPLTEDEIPAIALNDSGCQLHLIAGEYNGIKSNLNTYSPLLIGNIFTKENSDFDLDIPAGYNVYLYQLDGKTEINGKKIGDKTIVSFDSTEGLIQVKSLDSSRILLLAGKPIGEKITTYGPFVMNNTTEIMEAIRDAQQGKMGVLIEEF